MAKKLKKENLEKVSGGLNFPIGETPKNDHEIIPEDKPLPPNPDLRCPEKDKIVDIKKISVEEK